MFDENARFSLGCLGQFLIAILGVIGSGTIAFLQMTEGDRQATRTDATARELAALQNDLAVHLDKQEQWRKSPQLEVLHTQRPRKNEVDVVIQNPGGRDLVLFSIDLDPVTPLDEIKGGQAMPLPVIETAERSRVLRIDLMMLDVERQDRFEINPPVVVKPGESLVIKFIFPAPSLRKLVMAWTNAGKQRLCQYDPAN